MVSRNRLNKEHVELLKSRDPTIILLPIDDNLYKWDGYIQGPPDSAFEEGWFKLSLTIPENYPISPPVVKFITKIFHPNVHF